MAAYIQSGTMKLVLSAPKRKPFTLQMKELDMEAEAIEEEMDKIELPRVPIGCKSKKPDEWWRLNSIRAKIEKRLLKLDRDLNPEWYSHYGI